MVRPTLPSRAAGRLRMHPPRSESTAGPPEHSRLMERRHPASRQRLRQRIEREYQDMPGLSLTIAQARRLFGLETDVCARVLRELTQADVLRLTPNGLFVSYGSLP
jgi:hypothetical protein